jgi:glycosyltransferase involved in cell wall biosynthesis
MRLAVDAFNLAADRRGMGRIVRQTLEQLKAIGEADLVFVVRKDPAAGEITPRELARARVDAVWYPWNGMRFPPHAPSIVTINDPFAFTYPHPNLVARWREQSPIRRALREADCIVTISHWGASQLRRLFAIREERIRVITPALDPFWHPTEPPSRGPYILFVAGPDERKNARRLVEAYEGAFGAKGGPVLVVAGTLNEADEAVLQKMRAPHERSRPSDEELRALYSGAVAVVVPSLAEGYGMPAVEAMACGAPVLASNAAALPEACDGAAVLVPPEDAGAWRDALVRIAEDAQLRAELRGRSLERAARNDPLAPAKALLASARRLREAAR